MTVSDLVRRLLTPSIWFRPFLFILSTRCARCGVQQQVRLSTHIPLPIDMQLRNDCRVRRTNRR